MNRNQAKELMPIIQAFLEGKTIERKTRSWEPNKGWRDETQWENTEELIFRDTFVYRIKPEQKPSYRPFANAEECWQEMQKHKPFGWVKSTLFKDFDLVQRVTTLYVEINRDIIDYKDALEKFTFAYDTNFGVKVE